MVCQVQQLVCLYCQLVMLTDVHQEHHMPLMGVDLCLQLAHKELIHQSDSCPFHLLVNEGQEVYASALVVSGTATILCLSSV